MEIRVENIRKRFGEKNVIDCFSAVFPVGGTTCIMGPSGCGKTTLLRLMMGLIDPDEGTIIGMPERKSAVFQEDRLCENFSSVANVRLVCNPKVTREEIIGHLSDIGLGESLFAPVHSLSGGMRRRVAIVRAILAESDIIFMDEPYKGLDAALKKQVVSYVQEHTRGKTVLIVTHDEKEAHDLGCGILHMPASGPEEKKTSD